MSKPMMSQIAEFAEPPLALKHYGVKGMRWGVRKERSTRNPTRAERKQEERKPNVEKTIRVGAKKKTRAQDLSDAELKARIDRIQLEQRLSALEASPSVPKGKSFSQRMLEESGQIIIKTAVGMVATAVVRQAIDKHLGTKSPKMKSPWPPPPPKT